MLQFLNYKLNQKKVCNKETNFNLKYGLQLKSKQSFYKILIKNSIYLLIALKNHYSGRSKMNIILLIIYIIQLNFELHFQK